MKTKSKADTKSRPKTKAVKSADTVSKGYRLKPSTHNLIKKVQTQLSSTQENVIGSAIKLYSRFIKESNFDKTYIQIKKII